MAESADAGGLNPPDGNILRVQVPLRAPRETHTCNGFESSFEFGVSPNPLLTNFAQLNETGEAA
ncbi:MAG: hypothetical protein RLY19_846 [Actinomycetota bacterium]